MATANSNWKVKVFKARVKGVATRAMAVLRKQLQSSPSWQHDPVELLLSSLHTFFERLATEYNTTIVDEPLMVTVRRIGQQRVSSQLQLNAVRSPGEKQPKEYLRVLVSTSYWALSIRASESVVEFFVLPSTEVMTLPESELPSRAKLTLKLRDLQSSLWTMNDVIVSTDEMNALMRGLIKDIILRSKHEFENLPESMRLVASGQSFAGSVRSLVAEKHALVQKIVDQQESIQNQLARELHDSVLGNVMLLKRSFSSASKMPDEEAIALLDEIATRLREVCQELSPRDLKDCGLQPMLEELCLNLEARADCECQFICGPPIPEFPQEVSLHVYRIAQECFNNVANHAQATKVNLEIQSGDGLFTMSISDNGIGFDAAQASGARRTRDGGSGVGIIRERAELISCIYPARAWIESQPAKGTKMTLEIMISPAVS